MVTISGRTLSDESLARSGQTVEAEPTISRRPRSLRVCAWMAWHNPGGRPRDMSCRNAMLEMHRRGIITLPPVTTGYPCQHARQPVASPPLAAVACSLTDVGAVEIVRVTSRHRSALWRGMMDAHHDLKSGPLCGAQLRYWVRSERDGWIGGLSDSACARRVARRDAWIGWPAAARARNHILVVNNSRFVIAPSVQVQHLASHGLARCQARLVADWEAVYQYRPVLLETYVERGRCAGTCYRAATWRHVGTTRGRGRHGTGATTKDIYVLPLDASWQTVLCRGADGTIRVRTAAEPRAPREWIEAELGGTDVGDTRLTARLLQMTGMFYATPTANMPAACGSAHAATAAYRVLDNDAVEWQAILQSHYAATEERLRDHGLVLVAQDTTTLTYSTHPHTEGLGPIGTDRETVRGLLVHDTMAFTPRGTPVGLLNVQCWARDGIGTRPQRHQQPIEDTESWTWGESDHAVSAVQQRCRTTALVVVADREAEIHEVCTACAQTPMGRSC